MVEVNGETDTEMEMLEEQLRKEQAKVEEYKNKAEDLDKKYKYLLADYDNYRKRVEKESEIIVRREVEKFLTKLINLRDDYLRALEIARKSDNKSRTIVDGLESILKNLDSILIEEGIREIDALGNPFDPNIHEAVSFVDSEEYAENVVTAEIRKGYMLNDRVVRPSLVEVSKKTNKV